MTALPIDLAATHDFTLPDHRGGHFRLLDHLSAAGTVLIFYRGHWCPYCRRYLAKLQSNWSRFDERSVTVIGISPEPPATSAALVRDLSLSFRLLSDLSGRVIDHFGVRNGFSSTRTLLPHPAAIVLDGEGAIRFRSIDRNFKKRTTMRNIFSALDALR